MMSSDVANANLIRLQVVPLTSNSGRLYPSEAQISVAGQVIKAMADQLATVAKERLSKQLGVLSKDDLRQVERVLKIQLG
jgi:mRNA interferase MazF